jgi:hypothetical protein
MAEDRVCHSIFVHQHPGHINLSLHPVPGASRTLNISLHGHQKLNEPKPDSQNCTQACLGEVALPGGQSGHSLVT